MHYNTTNLQSGTAQFNGNIAEQVWKGGYDEYLRGYAYGYDQANRLKTSDYGFKQQATDNGGAWDYSMRYNENIPSYDHNGNILALKRYHGSLNLVDDLTYSYADVTNNNVNDGNHLHRVEDAMGATVNAGFFDYKDAPVHYRYDDNGNVFYDANKGAFMLYNYLNLPYHIDVSPGSTIDYLYDAAGNKLQKKVVDATVSPNKISITKYAGAFVYTNSYLSGDTPPVETLEFIGHEEGRIRPEKIDTTQAMTAANTKYIYDYFMRDHLGNTRMVLTTEQQTDLYAVTQEPANATKENQLFANVTNTNEPKPSGFDSDSTNTKVIKLNGGIAGKRVGPSIILKVMAGDVISISAKAWYTGPTQPVPDGLEPVFNQILTALQTGVLANNGSQHGAFNEGIIDGSTSNSLGEFLQTYQPYQPWLTKAFLNRMIVDEEFKLTNSPNHAGAARVQSMADGAAYQTLVGPAGMTVRRNGWLYVYLSNESNQDVFFDDLVINHQRGPVLEQTNYYAFGLEIPGLHSQAIGFGGSNDNRLKFNKGSELQSKEFSNGGGLTWYATQFRMYDPQIGRWMVADMKPDYTESLYSAMKNNPINYNDPLGDTVNQQGFTQQQFLKYLSMGINSNSKNNPYYFDKNGNVQINNKKYEHLSDQQKAIVNNMKGAIDSKISFTVIKTNKDEKIGGNVKNDNGDVMKNPSFSEAGMMGMTEKIDATHIHINIVDPRDGMNQELKTPEGKDLSSNPTWLSIYHEVGGHSFYRYVEGDQRSCRAIDYENQVRTLNGMQMRGYDGAHPDK